MEERLQAAERAFRESPEDSERAHGLARLALRAGDLGLALEATRGLGPDDELRAGVGRELADRLDLSFSGVVAGFERFSTPTQYELTFVPGGDVLEEGASADSILSSASTYLESSPTDPSNSDDELPWIVLTDFWVSRVAASSEGLAEKVAVLRLPLSFPKLSRGAPQGR